MRSAYEYTIPTGDGLAEVVVTMVEPTIDQMLQAEKQKGDPLFLLRNCIVEIDGATVTYQDLRGAGLGEKLPVRAIQALALMLADLTTPSKEEVESAKGSRRVVAR